MESSMKVNTQKYNIQIHYYVSIESISECLHTEIWDLVVHSMKIELKLLENELEISCIL